MSLNVYAFRVVFRVCASKRKAQKKKRRENFTHDRFRPWLGSRIVRAQKKCRRRVNRLELQNRLVDDTRHINVIGIDVNLRVDVTIFFYATTADHNS